MTRTFYTRADTNSQSNKNKYVTACHFWIRGVGVNKNKIWGLELFSKLNSSIIYSSLITEEASLTLKHSWTFCLTCLQPYSLLYFSKILVIYLLSYILKLFAFQTSFHSFGVFCYKMLGDHFISLLNWSTKRKH